MNSDTGLLDQQRTGILVDWTSMVYWTSNEQGYWFIGPAMNRDTGYWTSNEQGYWFIEPAMNRDTGLSNQQ